MLKQQRIQIPMKQLNFQTIKCSFLHFVQVLSQRALQKIYITSEVGNKKCNYFCISVQIGQCYDGEKNLNENITFKTVYLMGLGDALIYVNCRNVLNLDRYFYPDSLYSCRPLKRVFQWPSKYQDPLCILIKKILSFIVKTYFCFCIVSI